MGSRKAEGFVGRGTMTQRLSLAMRGKTKNAKSMATREGSEEQNVRGEKGTPECVDAV